MRREARRKRVILKRKEGGGRTFQKFCCTHEKKSYLFESESVSMSKVCSLRQVVCSYRNFPRNCMLFDLNRGSVPSPPPPPPSPPPPNKRCTTTLRSTLRGSGAHHSLYIHFPHKRKTCSCCMREYCVQDAPPN